MGIKIRGMEGDWLYSGIGVEGTATARSHPKETAFFDVRGLKNFALYASASSNGPTAQASAIFTVYNSYTKNDFVVLATITASAGTAGSKQHIRQQHSAGPYGWLAISLDKVYSAAQTGTAHLFAWIQPERV